MTTVLVVLAIWLGYYLGRIVSRNECREKIYELEMDLAGWKMTAKRQSDLIRMGRPQ